MLKKLIEEDDRPHRDTDKEFNPNANDLAEIKSAINSLRQQYNSPNSFHSAANDYHLSPQHQSRYCPKCSGSSGYLDMLKYELGKRIELQVARGNLDNWSLDKYFRLKIIDLIGFIYLKRNDKQ